MSDPFLSDIDFKNKMALVLTALKIPADCWGRTVMDAVLGTFFCDYDVLPAYVQQCIQTEAISEVRPYVHKLYI